MQRDVDGVGEDDGLLSAIPDMRALRCVHPEQAVSQVRPASLPETVSVRRVANLKPAQLKPLWS